MLSRRVFRELTAGALGRSTGRVCCRHGSSSTRWKTRQGNDYFAREARVQGLKSRAAFKLLELNDKHKLFAAGQTVVDLGFAPGSWSQVAVNRTTPGGRVIGIDVIPAQPPRGVSTIQGNFLSADVQNDVRAYVRDPALGRAVPQTMDSDSGQTSDSDSDSGQTGDSGTPDAETPDAVAGRVVDVVLSDMSEPWEQVGGFYKKSLSDPYFRMMNTSGNGFRDHAGSMDLCMAALAFAFDTVKTGGHFLCKFYQGAEDRAFESRLRRLFAKVSREKPESSRAASKEAYFVALRRRAGATREEVFGDGS